MIKTLNLMLRIIRAREENRLAALRRARGELDRVQGVVGQLENYAQEYRQQMVRQAVAGTTASELMATLDFERKLGVAAHGQKLVVGQLEHNVGAAKAQAVEARLRAQGVEKLLNKKKRQLASERQQAEAREIEESLAARKVIDGMNDA